jgi:hypothetical protein
MQNPPYLRNVNNGRVFPYNEDLAKQKNLSPYWGDDLSQAEMTPKEPDYYNMHWQKLKKIVEEAGGEYVSRDHAIEFLKSVVV